MLMAALAMIIVMTLPRVPPALEKIKMKQCNRKVEDETN